MTHRFTQPVFIDTSSPVSQEEFEAYCRQIPEASFAGLVNDLKEFREGHKLDDWLYYQLIRRIADQLAPKTANYHLYTIYKWYLLKASGFDAILAYADGTLLFYVHCEENIYNIPIRREAGKNYVCLNYHDYGFKIDFEHKKFNTLRTTQGENTTAFSYRVSSLPNVRNMTVTKDLKFTYNEQDYHFKVLFLILQKLGKSWAEGLYHLSYGMVDLPSGKMKSREGTVVDADELMDDMIRTAQERTEELGKVDGFSVDEKADLYNMIGLGALKFFLLKVEPKKRLLFDPNESIDFQGHTGPFIQYTHARICSVLAKANYSSKLTLSHSPELTMLEKELIVNLSKYPGFIAAAAKEYSPAHIANYIFELAKLFNKFYHEESILKAEDLNVKNFRLDLAAATASILNKGMALLGIRVPERM
jgi:hypothetical protein